MVTSSFFSRFEHFTSIGSTNDVVRDWLDAGTGEVCVAVAEEQTAGRGRNGRRWLAPRGAALLVSLGFRPRWIPADRAWQIAAAASVAMAEAAEQVAGLETGRIRLKWPNDLVVASSEPGQTNEAIRKIGGVLGESVGLGTDDPRVIVGIGVNVDWLADEFPDDLAPSMTSLRVLTGDATTPDAVLDAFLDRLETAIGLLRSGEPPLQWPERQVTTGRLVHLELSPADDLDGVAIGVDSDSGALLVRELDGAASVQAIHAGEVIRARLPDAVPPDDTARDGRAVVGSGV